MQWAWTQCDFHKWIANRVRCLYTILQAQVLLQSSPILQCIFMFVVGWKKYNMPVWQQIPVGGNLGYTTWLLLGKDSSALPLRSFPSASFPSFLPTSLPTEANSNQWENVKTVEVLVDCFYLLLILWWH